MFNAHGFLQINNGVRIIVNMDILRYYKRLFEFATFNTLKYQFPAHGAHITIINPKIHKFNNYNMLYNLKNLKVEFTLHPEKITYSHVNCWMPVTCEFAENLKKSLNIRESNNWKGLHLTICNNKYDH